MLFQKLMKTSGFFFLHHTAIGLLLTGLIFMGITIMTSDASSILTPPFPLHCNYGCPITKDEHKVDTYPHQLFTLGRKNDGQPGHWLAYYVTTTILSERDARREENHDPSLSILDDTITATPDFFWGNKSPAWEKLLTMEERLAEEPGIAHTFVLTGPLRDYTNKTLQQKKLTNENQADLHASLWKIISINSNAHTFVSAFIFPPGSEKAENYCPFLVDVSAIERATGLIFFPQTSQLVPEQLENHFQELHPYIECP
ncbi:hypothetical protein [Kiloniella sp. EL199]|uniref:hypothetical protein n=1 Tax=Kiloniella sp. EL199 TaxID=2107581 RepID=UPI000EA0CC3A|nr:hypothetical protein [Kiloniella sp. EL199]